MIGTTSRRIGIAFILLLTVACGEPDASNGSGSGETSFETATAPAIAPTKTPEPLPTVSPSSTASVIATQGWISLPTQEAGGPEMAAELHGQLVEADGCLWVAPVYPGHMGGNYLIVWPHGYSARDEDDQIVVRDADSEVVARVGDEIYMGGGGEGRGSHGDDCTGQLWIAGSTVRTGPPPTPHPSAMGTYPPLPAPEEMGATTLEYLMPMYEERSGNPEVLLSRVLTGDEVYELAARTPLANTRIDPARCADGLRNENWYCHPGSQPVLAVVRGD